MITTNSAVVKPPVAAPPMPAAGGGGLPPAAPHGLSPGLPAPGTNDDIHPIKPPIAIPDGWWWVWVILGVLVVAVLAWLAWRYWKKKAAQAAIVPVVPPHTRARERLAAALALIAEPRPFCIAVSDAVRQYLEERFEFHAPERTTEEFLHELRATMLLTIEQKESLGEFLNVCDMVKFARYEPGRTELQALYDAATRLIDETEPPPAPVGGAGETSPTKA